MLYFFPYMYIGDLRHRMQICESFICLSISIADSPFLLRFLRTKKFSVPQACSLLEKYLATRQIYSRWFRNLNYDDPVIQEIINCGYLVPLPCRDSQNRLVMMACPGKVDKTCHFTAIYKVMGVVINKVDFVSRSLRSIQVHDGRHGQDPCAGQRVSHG